MPRRALLTAVAVAAGILSWVGVWDLWGVVTMAAVWLLALIVIPWLNPDEPMPRPEKSE